MQNLALSLFIMISLLFGSFALGQGLNVTSNGCSITNYISSVESHPPGFRFATIVQNKVTPVRIPIVSYNASCPGNIRVNTNTQYYSGQLNSIEQFWRDLDASQIATPYKITVTPIGNTSGPQIQVNVDTLNRIAHSNLTSYTYLGSRSNPAKVRVEMVIQPFYVISNVYRSNYEWQYSSQGIHPVTLYNDQNKIISYAGIIPVFYASSRPCTISTYETEIKPAVINFGDLSKQEMMNGKVVKRSFNFTLRKKQQGSNCGLTFAPKVTFTPLDNYENNNIYLNNGLMMQFKDDQGQYIPMAKPHHLKSLNTNQLTTKIDVQLQKNNKKSSIQSGNFSSTVVYLMEYY